MRKLELMRKVGFVIGIIVLCISVMPVSNGLPAQAAEPPQPAPPQPQATPLLPPPTEPPPVIDGHGTGFIPPSVGGAQAGGGCRGAPWWEEECRCMEHRQHLTGGTRIMSPR